ncbi:hypothetical protein [Xanthomonas hortorum]|uniref:Uncharacterized protein n=1 Tax=Xanthomonas hortorum pv. gardneri TaxID=2754056 RepID=A0A6V7DAX3_9XANT|nr:hypothetical protein [Xanthomonas hortorum]APP80714.1 hypothetical protein BJD10_14275 [Xanthomonas hortorum pv. gardneri]EGD19284.1 hypothetical protein XGA_2080 [Xanthomonas hortorum ATCC 19865]KLA95877.1 hypothetical protein SM19410_14080 [Xanthomonas hortorum pv. gardneri]KLA99812.1 hypothetical protein SM17710_08840 [Xanthomonas hortorum pv. gardneri]KLA99916.1 hypothetical protein SM18210_15805 [Xanthomonas hortorum pv. gardneri]
MKTNTTRSTSFVAKAAAGVTAAAASVMAGSAFAAGEVAAAMTDGIDKSDLLAGGVIVLGACAVIAMIGLGRRLAK